MTGEKSGEGRTTLQPFFDGLKQHLKKSVTEALTANRTPRQLRAAADTTMDAYGSAVAGLEKLSPPEKPLACKKGCDHCCHIAVMVDGATVMRIADYVQEAFSPAERTLLEMRLVVYEEKVEKMTQDERSRALIPCPLLADGACTVHPVRPLICRSFNSYDADICRKKIRGAGSVTEIPAWNIPWLVGLALDDALKDSLVEAGYTEGTLELGLAVKAALDRPNAAERWLAGDRVFARAAWSARAP